MSDALKLVGDAATEQLAEDIAMIAAPGWVIRLDGDLGAGKTTFARAFIRALAKDASLEIPSPTYTLVQRYDEADPPVLHADLYRLSDPSEMVELGLEDEDDPAIRLIEWPGQAGAGAFADAITLYFAMEGEQARTLRFGGPEALLKRIERSRAIRAFLGTANRADATRQRLLGDASTRRYERLADEPLIVMDAARQPDGPVVQPDTGNVQQAANLQPVGPSGRKRPRFCGGRNGLAGQGFCRTGDPCHRSGCRARAARRSGAGGHCRCAGQSDPRALPGGGGAAGRCPWVVMARKSSCSRRWRTHASPLRFAGVFAPRFRFVPTGMCPIAVSKLTTSTEQAFSLPGSAFWRPWRTNRTPSRSATTIRRTSSGSRTRRVATVSV
jgi:tRNA threonylcarbamoyl adenosine modification protein YjeE